MMDYRVKSAVALDERRVEVVWTDGLSGIVDFSEMIDGGGVFSELSDPALFKDVRIYEYGHGLYWVGADGSEIDICPDVLRSRVDKQVAAWIAEEERGFSGRTAAE